MVSLTGCCEKDTAVRRIPFWEAPTPAQGRRRRIAVRFGMLSKERVSAEASLAARISRIPGLDTDARPILRAFAISERCVEAAYRALQIRTLAELPNAFLKCAAPDRLQELANSQHRLSFSQV